MTFKIGSKYEETKSRLRQHILDGSIKVLRWEIPQITENGAQCIFCRQHIDSVVIQLIEEYENGYSLYPSDIRCFRQAQLNFYFENIPFPIN